MERFSDRVALVTGGGNGIGRATCARLAREGARVVVADVDGNAAHEVAQEIQDTGGSALPIEADVTEATSVERMIAEAANWKSRLDVVVPNAGISRSALVDELAVSDWDLVIATNLRGVFLTCKFAIPWLVKSGRGAIVTIGSSMAGWDSSPGGAAYMASKEGVTGLTRSLALQLGRHGVRVNSVCPGVVQTRLGKESGMSDEDLDRRYEQFAQRIPLGRVGQPEDVAATIAFLASDDAAHISGAMLLIDGGQTLQSWSNAPATDAYPLGGTW
jgi:NAD(P)-dependent dehydrogenase (short-subunit alcohol dehydrogenase family)